MATGRAPLRGDGLPLDGGGGPGEACAEGDHDDFVATFDFSFAVGFIERDGDGRSGGVAVFVKIDEDAVVGDGEAVSDGIDDAEIGLVRDDEGDVLGAKLGAFDDGVGRVLHAGDGVFKNLASRHRESGEAFTDIFWGGGTSGSATGDIEDAGLFSVGADVGGDDLAFAFLGGTENCGARAIAEKDASGAICPIDEGGEFFCSDDKGISKGSALDHALGDFHGVEEAGASGRDVKGDGFGGADLFLDVAGGGGREGIGRDGGDDDEFDVFSGDPGLFERFEGRFGTKVGGVFSFGGDAALFDPGARDDPLVGGFYKFGEVIVGEDFFRKVTSGACDGNALTHGESEGEGGPGGKP